MLSDEESRYARMGLKVRGRHRTEARLRELYAAADDNGKGDLARFLVIWKSRRGLNVADDWIESDAPQDAFHHLLVRYALCDGIKTADRFLRILERDDLSNDMRDDAVDGFSDCIDGRARHPRYQEFVAAIARHLEHPCAEVRWTATFSVAKLRAEQYRDQLVTLQEDQTKTRYGYISGLARNAVRFIDGDDEVDLHDATQP